MAKNYVPDGKVALLVGDKGNFDAFPTPTEVNGVQIAATIEEQSTTRLHKLPGMTTVQMAAVAPAVDGMIGYDTTLNDLILRKNGVLTQVTANPLGILYATGTMTAAQINGMNAVPFQLLPAPGAGKLIVIKQFLLNVAHNALFTNGGAITLQYSPGNNASEALSALNLTASGANKSFMGFGATDELFPSATSVNAPIFITNDTAAFAAGGTSTVTWSIWYSIIPAV